MQMVTKDGKTVDVKLFYPTVALTDSLRKLSAEPTARMKPWMRPGRLVVINRPTGTVVEQLPTHTCLATFPGRRTPDFVSPDYLHDVGNSELFQSLIERSIQMKTVSKAVKLTDPTTKKLKQVSSVDVPVYENVDELISLETEERILGMFNKQNAIRMQGNERAKFQTHRAGKQARRSAAFNLLSADEIAEFAGRAAELQAHLDSDEMQQRVDDSLAADTPTDEQAA